MQGGLPVVRDRARVGAATSQKKSQGEMVMLNGAHQGGEAFIVRGVQRAALVDQKLSQMGDPGRVRKMVRGKLGQQVKRAVIMDGAALSIGAGGEKNPGAAKAQLRDGGAQSGAAGERIHAVRRGAGVKKRLKGLGLIVLSGQKERRNLIRSAIGQGAALKQKIDQGKMALGGRLGEGLKKGAGGILIDRVGVGGKEKMAFVGIRAVIEKSSGVRLHAFAGGERERSHAILEAVRRAEIAKAELEKKLSLGRLARGESAGMGPSEPLLAQGGVEGALRGHRGGRGHGGIIAEKGAKGGW